MTQTVIIRGDAQRLLAHKLVEKAPPNAIVTFREETRTNDQNALLWSRLSDLSRAKPDGRRATPESWKNLVMHAAGYAVQFENGLDGQPFPVGFRSSRLTVKQCSELLAFVEEYGARFDVKWSDLP